MKITRAAVLTACAITGACIVQAQGLEKTAAFQFVTALGDAGAYSVRVDTVGGKVVTGKPFSATEVRRTRQTLGDGTHIDKNEKDKYFRDHEGRTRVEREDGATVIITDPLTGATTETNNGKSRVMMRRGSYSVSNSVSNSVSGTGLGYTTSLGAGPATVMIAPATEMHKEMLDKMKAEAEVRVVALKQEAMNTSGGTAITVADKGATEDLGDQMINGVMAHGTRNTITIPTGQIGNDREIRVVSERWFSNDLGVLIRSSNNDPRFGETTFELTDILQGTQDPTLFQAPASAGNHK